MPKLVIVRGRGAAAARIELDGVVLGEAQIGSEISADPGPHVIAGTVPDGRRFMQTIALAEGETKRVELNAPDDPATAPDVEPPPAGPSQPAPVPQEPTEAARPGGSALPWVIGGIGVASLALSGVFHAQQSSAKRELEAGCLGKTCPDTLQETQSRGETYATLTNVTLGVGVVAIGVAVVMLIAGRSPRPEAQAGWTIAVRPQASATALDLGARF
jgi:hypothetical protein